MRSTVGGYRLELTHRADLATLADVASYTCEGYAYLLHEDYGSPEVDVSRPVIKSVQVASDRRSVRLVVDGLREGHVHELHVPGLRSVSGRSVLHPTAYYTLNALPEL